MRQTAAAAPLPWEAAFAALPQAAQIKPSDRDAWIASASLDPAHDLLWHIKRLGGFGGSDIGALVSAELGIFDPFASARDLVRAKLCRDPLSAPTARMRRGTEMEPLIAHRFHQDYQARRDEAAIAALSAAVDPAHPWMRYSPDDVVRIGARRYLVDYKAPDAAGDQVMLRYCAQLHQGAHLLEQAGVAVDGLLLVNFSWQDYAVLPLEVPMDPQLTRDLCRAGDKYWRMVLDGEEPQSLRRVAAVKAAPAPAPEQVEALGVLEARMHAADLVAKAAKQQADAARDALIAGLTDAGLSLAEAPLSALTGRRSKSVLDESALLTFLGERGVAPEDCQSPGAYDAEALAAALVAAGGDPEACRQPVFDPARAAEALKPFDAELADFTREDVSLFTSTPRQKALRARYDAALVAAEQVVVAGIAQLDASPAAAPAASPHCG